MTETGDVLPLELEAVSLTAGKKRVLKDVTCRFDDTVKLSVILGPNGAGKSLLLKVCHGLISPDQGSVRWHGGSDPGLTRQSQAMVFQRPVLLRRSVRANIDFALKLQRLTKAERRQRIAEALDKIGLSRHAARPARLLSFGEQQRLAMGRAWALRPKLLLLDEPSANLDPASTYMIEQIVEDAVSGGTRVIMATHDLNQARRLAGEILFIHRGRIKEHAPAEQFFAGPKNDLAQAFLRGELLWWRRRALFAPEDGKPDDPF